MFLLEIHSELHGAFIFIASRPHDQGTYEKPYMWNVTLRVVINKTVTVHLSNNTGLFHDIPHQRHHDRQTCFLKELKSVSTVECFLLCRSPDYFYIYIFKRGQKEESVATGE